MNEKLLKEYVQAVVQEGGYFMDVSAKDDDFSQKKKKPGWWQKLKNLFNTHASSDEFSEEWIEDRELYDDMEFSDDVKDKVKDYTRKKMPRIAARTKGDMNRAKSLMKRSLDTKFAAEITALKRAAREREREEDADID